MLDRKIFFDEIRRDPFNGLDRTQVEGIEAILDAHELHFKDRTPPTQLSYCLATTHHETGAKMRPVTENLNYTSAARIRAVWPSRFPTVASAQPYVRNPQKLANFVYGGRMGNDDGDDGWLYRGRTLVQLTGKENYERATKELQALGFDVDLVKNPDDANRADIAPVILFLGMEEGWFTGRTLDGTIDDEINGDEESDYIVARKIINGQDRARDIAKLAARYLTALIKAKISTAPAPTSTNTKAPERSPARNEDPAPAPVIESPKTIPVLDPKYPEAPQRGGGFLEFIRRLFNV